jgi:hypothetical protein
MNKNRLIKLFALALIFSVFSVVGLQDKALAYQGTGYFHGATTCTTDVDFNSTCGGLASISQNDVISGRTATNGVNVVPSAARTDKTAYYNWVLSQLDASQPFRDRQGAAFIINTMVGAGTSGNPARDQTPSASMIDDFRNRLFDPGISMSVVTADPNNYGNGRVSFSGKRQDSGTRDVFFTAFPASSRQMVLFRNSSGAVVYVLEVPCANPIGGLPGLPRANQWSLSPNSSVAASALRGQTVTFTHTVTNNGPDTMDRGFTSNVYWTEGTGPIAGGPVGHGAMGPGGLITRQTAFTIPANATDGQRWCQQVSASPRAYNNNNAVASGWACVTAFVPKAATITLTASRSVSSIEVNSSFTGTRTATVTTQATTSNLQNVDSDPFTYTISQPGGGNWSGGVAPGSYPVPLSPAGNKISSPTATLTVPANAVSLIGSNYCRQVQVTPGNRPTYSSINPPGGLANACVRIVGNNVTPTTNVPADHERYSGDKTSTHGIAANSMICDANFDPGVALTVQIYRVYGSTEVLVDTAPMNNCVLSGAYTSLPQVIPAADLDAIETGQSLAVNTIVRYAGNTVGQQPRAITVYQAPFVRFYGNDVRVCGNGDDNRFVFDQRAAPTGNASRGSWGQYATIFGANNTPFTNYNGLNSSRVNGNFPGGLRTEWNASNCTISPPAGTASGDNITVISNPTAFTGRYLIRNSGTIDIDQDIIMGATPAFDPETYPVVVIWANDINIANDVTQIDAVLIATNTINTCAGVIRDYWHQVISAPDVGCNNPLRINGALMANRVNFQRTNGTKLAPGAEDPINYTQPAEVVNFPWYLHFITLEGFPNEAETKFDAYYGLPPRL